MSVVPVRLLLAESASVSNVLRRELHKAAALLTLAFAGMTAQAQTPDTTAAWRYLPLALGNEWHTFTSDYNGYWTEYVQVRRVVLDEASPGLFTVETTTLRWRDDFPPTTSTTSAVWHFDENTQRVMDGDWAVTPCPLDASFDGVAECDDGSYVVTGGHGQTVSVGQEGVVTTRKQFRSTPVCECALSITYVYAAGIGEVSYSYTFSNGTDTTQRHRTLRFARVGGVELGEPLAFPVANEEAAAPAVLELSVAPNP